MKLIRPSIVMVASLLVAWRLFFLLSQAASVNRAPPCTKRSVSAEMEEGGGGQTKSNGDYAINFRLEQDHFITEMASCMQDSDCRIYYFHFQKTGGKDVEGRMFSMFPPKLKACCFEDTVARFHADTEKHCLAKFSSYEVSGPVFLNTIVRTCMTTFGGRALVLATYREPIQRTVSQIHQMCNKNLDTRNNETQQACLRCSYEQDKDFWNKTFIQKGVDEYGELQDVANSNIDNTSVLTIDTADLLSMYGRLSLLVNHTALRVKKRKTNPEITSTCNFMVTSEMMRGLKTSQEVYRNLTLGASV